MTNWQDFLDLLYLYCVKMAGQVEGLLLGQVRELPARHRDFSQLFIVAKDLNIDFLKAGIILLLSDGNSEHITQGWRKKSDLWLL